MESKQTDRLLRDLIASEGLKIDSSTISLIIEKLREKSATLDSIEGIMD